jgi:type IV fimbrial biogenesis protein FimT
MKLMQKQAGFSMMELMVVIGILAILLSIAIPNFIGKMPARRLESAAGDVNAALQRARLAAVRENACVVIEFNSSNDNYRIFVDNGGADPNNACNKTQDADEATIHGGVFPGGVDLFSVTPQSNIEFNSRGFPDNAVTISLKNQSGTTWTVTLNLTGSSRINRG